MHLVHNMTVLTREILHSLIVFKPQLEIGAVPYLFFAKQVSKRTEKQFYHYYYYSSIWFFFSTFRPESIWPIWLWMKIKKTVLTKGKDEWIRR